jgi:hypothetical protein
MATEFTMRTHPILQDTTMLNSVNLGITTFCSMRCPKCSINIPEIARKKEARHATVPEILKAASVMKPMRRVHLTGGEPTIHPLFQYLVKKIRYWFEAEYVTLETNGVYLDRFKHLIGNNCDLVFITHYQKDAVYEGNPDNTHIIQEAEAFLGSKLVREEPVRHVQSHLRLKPTGPLSDVQPCTKWWDPGLPCGWYNGKIYPCCVTFGIDESLGIPVTPDWREILPTVDKGCDRCLYRGT